MNRFRPVGWRHESYRHSLASRGISTSKYRRSFYSPTYVAADLPVMTTDAIGTAGAATVGLIPLVVGAGVIYGGTKYGVGQYKKYKKKKRKSNATKEEKMKRIAELEKIMSDPMTSEREFSLASMEYEQLKRESYAKKVDLNRYAGTWEQESVTPEPWFQKGCKDVKAKYEVKPDGNVKVTNYCDGDKIVGEAVPLSKDNRKLAVSFGFPWIPGKYEIKKLDPNYKRATVTSGEYTWRLRKIT